MLIAEGAAVSPTVSERWQGHCYIAVGLTRVRLSERMGAGTRRRLSDSSTSGGFELNPLSSELVRRVCSIPILQF